ncbi:MAG: hypothetical protein WCP74_03635 [Sphingobacteriia bacterium]|jgi:5'(3')-deoxyribonucleotidase
MKETILIISYSFLHKDPRVLRQIEVLKKDYHLVVSGLTNPNLEGIDFIQAFEKPKNNLFQTLFDASLTLFRFDYILYWRSIHIKELFKDITLNYKKSCPKLIICNDIGFLPLASKLKEYWNCKLIVDFHEYAPLELDNNFLWRLRYKGYYTRVLKKYIPIIDLTSTVCYGIQKKFNEEFNVLPEVIYNSPFFKKLNPTITEQNVIKLVHHGIASRSRKLEIMIDMMDFLDSRFELNLILVDNDNVYIEELKSRSIHKKVNFLPAVPTNDISEHINKFDIGLYILPPLNFNAEIALPNKFFEFIQARLCIAVGPSIEMKRVTEQYNIGIVAADFSPKTMAECLNKLTIKDVMDFKQKADLCSYELSFNSSASKIVKQVNQLLCDDRK